MRRLDFIRPIFDHSTAFAKAAICALVIGIGDLVATGADIIWLLGDMSVHASTYHYWVFGLLSSAFAIMGASFIWLYISVVLYCKRMNKKTKDKLKRFNHRYYEEGCHNGD